MTDTEILNSVMEDLKWHASTRRPISPFLAGDLLRQIEAGRECKRDANYAGPEWIDKQMDVDIALRKVAKQCPPGYAPCSIDDHIYWVGEDGKLRTVDWQDIKQYFWRCEHHTSALENWHLGYIECGHGCEKTELKWYEGGTHVAP